MNTVFGRQAFAVLLLCASIFAFSTVLAAQDLDNVTISGKVTDSNNAAVAGATVTATLTTTGEERTVVADDEGIYRIVQLKPGIYKLTFSASGFGIKEQDALPTVAGQNVQLNVELAPAGVTAEQIITLDDVPDVDTTRTVVGGTITQREIDELPVNSRNALDLVLTVGGTAEAALSVNDLADDRNTNPNGQLAENGNFSLSGGAAYSNNVTIDGLDNNDDRSSLDRFQPPIDSVAEVQVITNQFSAEYGRASGGRINLRTRAGGKQFRGRIFMNFRDDNLNANTYYNNSRGLARLPLTQYNPGFTFSGPVILPFGEGKSIYNGRNRTFFFVSYEYDKLDDTTLIDAYIPVVGNSRFPLPASTGGTPTCDNANASACTASTPTAAFVAPYNFTLPTPNRNNVFTARIDHKLTSNNDMTFGWQLGRRSNLRQRSGSLSRIEDTIQARTNDTDAFNFTDNHVFGANAVNQFRMQYSVFEPGFVTVDSEDPVILITYRDPVINGTRTLIAGNSTTSTNQNFSQNRKETRWQFQDSLTYIAGSHTLKGGFDIQNVNSQARSLEDATGTYNFASVLNFQNNVLSRYRQNFGTGSDVKNRYYGVFLNDQFKATSNLTLSLGLRYERETAVSDNDNFGPRLGIAWDPFKDGKGVVRFGAGIFYNRTLLRTVGDFIQNTSGNLFSFDTNNIGTSAADTRRVAVLGRIAQQFPNSYASVTDIRNTLTSLGLSSNLGFIPNNLIRTVDPDLKIPESYQFNVGFEREMGRGFVFEANYTINKTVHLWREFNPNAPVVPAGFPDFTAYLLANPFRFTNANGTVRTYTFFLGSTTDSSSVSCSFTANSTCPVNLNSINGISSTTSTPPTAATADSGNSAGSPLGIALAAIARFRPDQTVEQKERVASIGNSFYQGLVLEMRRRNRDLGYGFNASFRAVYTLSKLRDDGIVNTSDAEVSGDFSREWARALQDRRHRFALSGVFGTPKWLGRLNLSPIFRYGSSAPFNISIAQDRNLNDVSGDRVLFSGNIEDIVFREPGTPVPTALISQFSVQPIGSRSGNLPRNAGRGPSLYLFDLNVSREWKFGERMRLRPNIEFGNVLNMTVFSYGSEFINFATPNLAAFQTIFIPTRTFRQRDIRIGLRFDF